MTDRPKVKIFVDGGDPAESKKVRDALGYLDGQTTNPTLVSKNPHIRQRLAKGKITSDEALVEYKNIVQEISKIIPDGSISIEVYADHTTPTEEMLTQGREMYKWIPNAHIKFPTTGAGLAAAETAVSEGMRVNLTLCFSQPQAAAVYAATRGAKQGQVFVSPFVGRLDDRGEDGLSLVENILKMYQAGDGHVELLTASVRNAANLERAHRLGTDIITAPAGVILDWHKHLKGGFPEAAKSRGLTPIPYQELDLNADWRSFDLAHALTDQGIERFSADWNALIR